MSKSGHYKTVMTEKIFQCFCNDIEPNYILRREKKITQNVSIRKPKQSPLTRGKIVIKRIREVKIHIGLWVRHTSTEETSDAKVSFEQFIEVNR